MIKLKLIINNKTYTNINYSSKQIVKAFINKQHTIALDVISKKMHQQPNF